MLIKRYTIVPVDPALREYLRANGKPDSWSIVASDMTKAWAKFCRQRFGVLLPNPEDYDISLDR